MQRREQLLLYVLVATAVLYLGGMGVYSAFIKPIDESREKLAAVNDRIDKAMDQLIVLGAQRAKLKEWKGRSLPTDPAKQGARPDALNALRLYQDWLHDLALLSGFEDLRITPERRSTGGGNVYVAVNVKIEADARYDQLCHFLDRFYRTDLLHRVTALRVMNKVPEGNPLLQITLDAEGLAIVGAPQNPRLFPETFLDEEVSDDARVLNVKSSDSFPTKPGFLIRLGMEYMKVTSIDGTSWTVERAQDLTQATAHPADAMVELAPIRSNYVSRTPDEFKQLIEANLFVKPAPPTQYAPKFGPLGEKVFTRGRPIEFNIVLIGFDSTKGRPEFSLVSPQLPGMKIEKAGKFSWSPLTEQKTGTYSVKFEAKHPSAPGGKLPGTVSVVVRDPNTPPRFANKPVPNVYIGRDWKFSPEATDAESAATKLTWKLGENAPAGMKIDSKGGQITWTPPETVEVGDVNVQVIATDDGAPAQSATLNLRLKVEDDVAMFTKFAGIFAVNEDVRAMLFDQSQNKETFLRVGNKFAVADIKGTVTRIDNKKKMMLFSDGELTHRLDVGKSLRENTTMLPDEADALKPANVPEPVN